MSSSKRILPTDYINVLAEKLLSEFKWCYKDLYSKAFLMTMLDLRNSLELDNNYVAKADKLIQENSKVYILMAMTLINNVYEGGLETQILANRVPLKDKVFMYIYGDMMEKIRHDLMDQNEINSAKSFFRVLESLKTVNVVFCWNFLFTARNRGMTKNISEEYYLLGEILAFKKRTEENG